MSAYQSEGRWRYRFTYKGKRYSGTTPRGANLKKVAEQLEAAHLKRLVERRFTGVMPTVKEFVSKYLDHQRARVKQLTIELQSGILNRHLLPSPIAAMQLDEVHAEHMDQLATTWKAADAAATTINTRLGTVQTMFSLAVEWKYLASVPKVTYLKVPKDTVRYLTEAEADALLAAAEPAWRTMILAGLRTGMRIGELRGLQWADVDLARGRLTVRRTDPGRLELDSNDPKGGRFRLLPLTADLRAVLEQLRGEAIALRGAAWRQTDWVWPTYRGKGSRGRALDTTRSQSTCVHAMERITLAAKLDDVGWHTLRHTFASWLVMRGLPLSAVRDLLGHASIKMTEKYAHLAPDFAGDAAVALLEQRALPPAAKDDE